MSHWSGETMFGFDTETTGTDVETARIVQIAQVMIDPSVPVITQDVQLINAGVDIPQSASNIHKITTERMKREGGDPAKVLDHFASELAAAMAGGTPIVGMNLAYDMTLMDRELRRHALKPLPDRLGRAIGPIVDVFVLDKYCDQFRPGQRRLKAMAAHYGVPLGDDAHDAGADALASCRIAWKIASWGRKPVEFFRQFPHVRTSRNPDQDAARLAAAYRQVADLSLVELHQRQAEAKVEQDRRLVAHLAKRGEACDADGLWPMRPYQQASGVSA